MGGAFLRAMDMKICQSEAFFNALSIQQVKSSLHGVNMMSYKQNTLFFCCWGGRSNKKTQLRPESRPGTSGRAASSWQPLAPEKTNLENSWPESRKPVTLALGRKVLAAGDGDWPSVGYPLRKQEILLGLLNIGLGRGGL